MSDPLFARFGREYQPGDVLFREGESGEVMFVIQSGAVRITKDIAGEEKVLAVLGAGEFVGEMAIFNNKPRNATATVLETTRCLVIEGRTLESMLARNTEIAVRLVKKLAKRLDSADALIEILMHRDPKARVMLALARHAESFGEQTDGGIRIRTSAEELAREVSVPIEFVQEVMSRLRRLRLVTEEPPSAERPIRVPAMIVADVGRLLDFLDFLELPQKSGGES